MKHRQDSMVRCPYYRWEEKQRIVCEGPQEGVAIHLTFGSLTALKEYKKQLCKGCYNKCLIAGMLNRKYDYEEDS